VDIGIRGIFREQVWLGAVYRHHDAVSAIIGYFHRNYLLIGYSYDITSTPIRRYASGTHEVMLGLRFSRPQTSAWEKAK
jgi:hypothetical protein